MRTACALAVVLLGAALLFWFERRAPSTARPANVLGAADAPGTLREPAALDEPMALREAPPERQPELPISLAPRRGTRDVVIELVQHGSGRPVVGADVWARSVVRDEDERRYESGAIEFEEVAERLRSDERGCVRVEAVLDTEVRVLARKGTWLGGDETMEVPSDVDPPLPFARIELFDDFGFSVRVLDSEGGPADGVSLSLRAEGIEGAETITDADGIGTFEHVGIRCAERLGQDWTVEAEILAREPVSAHVGRELPPPSPVVIRLPATGSVRLRIQDSDGMELEDGSRVSLSFAATEADPAGEERSPFRYQETVAGEVLFGQVELGCGLRALASRGTEGFRAEARFAGPRVRGEEVQQRIVFGASAPILPLRILLPDGQPFAERSVTLKTSSNADHHTLKDTDTDRDGVLRLDVDQAPGEVRRVVSVSAWTGEEMGARFELSLPLSPGVHERRDVVLAPAPVLLAGVIVDLAGNPVAKTELQIAYQPADNPGWFTNASLETDEHGAFERRESCAADELLVRVSREQGEGKPVRVKVGDTGVRLVLDDAPR